MTYGLKLKRSLMMKQSSSTNTVREALSNVRRLPVHIDSVAAREEILRGNYVFLTHHLSVYEGFRRNYSQNEQCSVGVVRLPMSVVRVGPIVPRGSPYERVINYG